MAAYGLLTMYNLTAEIGVSQQSETWTYAPLQDGFDNVAEALNETVQQYFFLLFVVFPGVRMDNAICNRLAYCGFHVAQFLDRRIKLCAESRDYSSGKTLVD